MSEPLRQHPGARFARASAAEPEHAVPLRAALGEPDALPAEGDYFRPPLRDAALHMPKPEQRPHPTDLTGDDAATDLV